MSGDYDVGYGKPPKHTRFRQGQSGNPTGRPKGARNLKTELLEELQEQILVREGGRQKHVSKQRAMLKSLTAKAVQGDTKAASVILGIIYRLFHADEGENAETPIPAEDSAILENLRERLVESRLPKAAKPSKPKKTKE